MRRAISKIAESRLFWVLFSLVVAVIAWVYVSNQVNPVRTDIITCDIRYENDAVLETYGLRLAADTPKTANIRVEGTATDLDRIRQNAEVVVDLSSVTEPGEEIDLQFTLAAFNSLTGRVEARAVGTGGVGSNTVRVKVIRVVEQQYDISLAGVEYDIDEGDDAVTYVGDVPAIEPESVVIEGPEEAVSNIAYVEAVCTAQEPLTVSTNLTAELVAYDAEGEPIDEADLEDVTFSPETATVIVPVSMVKEVPLVENLVYAAGATPRNTTCVMSQESVQLIGEPSVLEEIDSILLPEIALDTFDQNTTRILTIVPPAQTEIYDGEEDVELDITVSGLATMEFTTDRISHNSTDESVSVEIINTRVTVTIRGPEEILEELEDSDISIIADLSDLSRNKGQNRVNYTVRIDGYDDDEVGALYFGEKISVNIQERT